MHLAIDYSATSILDARECLDMKSDLTLTDRKNTITDGVFCSIQDSKSDLPLGHFTHGLEVEYKTNAMI